MKITIEIPDTLVTFAQNYTDITLVKAQKIAKDAVIGLVISEFTKKIRSDGTDAIDAELATKTNEFNNIINLI